MAGNYRTRNQVFAAKIESAPGTEATIAVASDAILVEQAMRFSPNFETLQTREMTGTLDGAGPLTGGGYGAFTVPLYLKGPGTAGVAPEFGPLLRACAMAEVLTAADVTGTAQSGGSTSSIKLAAGASATDNAYRGMVIEITGGTNDGVVDVIVAYNGTTKIATLARTQGSAYDNTSTYAILANALYKPASTGLETITAYAWQRSNTAGSNARRRRLIGAAGTFRLEIPVRGYPMLTFNLRGIIPGAPDNVADPSGAVFDTVRPRPFMGATALLAGSAFKFGQASVDYGATVDQADDPAAVYGFDVAEVMDRRITGSVNPTLELLSTRDLFTDWLAGTGRVINYRFGSAAGNRVSILMPAAVQTNVQEGDNRGAVAEDVTFESTGADAGLFVCFY